MPQTVNRIAAGEVIERPASVVKELVENALDAGAGEIEVVTAAGGLSLIRITDDGCGMSAGRPGAGRGAARHLQARRRGPLQHRHAGLPRRGAALDRVHRQARPSSRGSARRRAAHEIVVDRGAKQAVRPAALNAGTCVEVRELFSATPARLKFLKSERAENMGISEVVKRLAMAHPTVGFTLTTGERAGLKLPAQPLGPDGHLARLGRIMGREFLDDALPVDIEREGVRVSGFAGLPTLHRPDPGQQYLFVNGRPVKDKLLIGAVRAAYGDLLPKARYPLLALFVTLCPARGRRQRAPEQGRGALPRRGARALVWSPARCARRWRRRGTAPPPPAGSGPSPASRGVSAPPRRRPRISQRGLASGFARGEPACRAASARPCRRRSRAWPTPSADARAAAEPAPADLLDRPLGAARAQLHETYIVAQTRTSVVIVDQHAAHERLVYERLKAGLANGGVARQGLLIPQIVELDADEAAALAEAAPRPGEARARRRGVRAGRGDGARGAGAAGRHRRRGPGARPGAGGDEREPAAACSRSAWRRCARPWPATAACAPGGGSPPRR